MSLMDQEQDHVFAMADTLGTLLGQWAEQGNMPAQAAYQLVEGIHGLFVHDPPSEQSTEEWLEVARLLELRARHIRDGIKRSAS